jgi:hypothetical protein
MVICTHRAGDEVLDETPVLNTAAVVAGPGIAEDDVLENGLSHRAPVAQRACSLLVSASNGMTKDLQPITHHYELGFADWRHVALLLVLLVSRSMYRKCCVN